MAFDDTVMAYSLSESVASYLMTVYPKILTLSGFAMTEGSHENDAAATINAISLILNIFFGGAYFLLDCIQKQSARGESP